MSNTRSLSQEMARGIIKNIAAVITITGKQNIRLMNEFGEMPCTNVSLVFVMVTLE